MHCPGRCRCSDRFRGPRHLDKHQLAAVADGTLRRYRQVVLAFHSFLVMFFPEVSGAEEVEDALMEYKQQGSLKKSDFESLIAALEFANPTWKRRMQWARAAQRGWAIEHQTRHTVPLSRRLACLFAIYMVGLGAERLAIAMLVQRELGLRPSEILAVESKDVSLPEHRHDGGGERAIVALGVRAGTKAKRPQAVVLRQQLLVGLLRYLCATAKEGEPIVGVSYASYRKILLKIEHMLKLDLGLTPHSPRSGYATEAIQEGHDFVAVKEGGRWVSDASLRQ